MEPPNYEERFFEALRRAFAATSPQARTAYFDLASFYREKMAGGVQIQPSSPILMSLAAAEAERKRA